MQRTGHIPVAVLAFSLATGAYVMYSVAPADPLEEASECLKTAILSAQRQALFDQKVAILDLRDVKLPAGVSLQSGEDGSVLSFLPGHQWRGYQSAISTSDGRVLRLTVIPITGVVRFTQ